MPVIRCPICRSPLFASLGGRNTRQPAVMQASFEQRVHDTIAEHSKNHHSKDWGPDAADAEPRK